MNQKPPMYRLAKFRKTLERVASVLEYGEKKHGNDENWRSYSVEKDLDAVLRHMFKVNEGPDAETGESHIVHAVCRLLFAHEKQLNEEPIVSGMIISNKKLSPETLKALTEKEDNFNDN